ncbi:hypothetical protein TNCV_2786281 [Trichonephila clavipes]|nr:hypothetical protein TNCV_2786281 [Trichonephila clavipes]
MGTWRSFGDRTKLASFLVIKLLTCQPFCRLGDHVSDQLNLAVLSLKEKGDLARLENKWWFDRSECRNGDTKVGFRDISIYSFLFDTVTQSYPRGIGFKSFSVDT